MYEENDWGYEEEEIYDFWDDEYDLDMGFDPYEGCYTFDC